MDVKQAVARARELIRDFLSEVQLGTIDFRIEEIERGPTVGTWSVTFSYLEPEEIDNPAAFPSFKRTRRKLQSIEIDDEGKFVALKLRSPFYL